MSTTDRRLSLHEELCSALGSRNVYFQPPASVKMAYPAIVYSLSDIRDNHANNGTYTRLHAYQVTVIDRDPDSEIPGRVLDLRSCGFERHFAAENLNHYVFRIYR